MIVAIVVPQFPPKWLAGAEVATLNLAKQLAKRGHTIHVITYLDEGEGLSPECFEDGYYVHRIKIPFPKIGMINCWLNIIKTIKHVNPDIIHLQQFVVLGTGIPVLLAHFLLKKPYIIYFRGFCVFGKDQCIYKEGLISSALPILIIKHAATLIVLTEYMKKKFASWPNKRIFTIPNGIDISVVTNLNRDVIRDELSIKECEHILLFVGRLHEVKGLKYLISAMNIIRDKDKFSRLIIIGNDQGERKILDELIAKFHLEKKICFIANVSQENIFRYMMASDIFILPSMSEGFPNVLLEAMACGIPIIASNIGGISEIIQDERNGLLVQPRNPEDIGNKILLLLKNEPLRKKISGNNFIDVKEFNWNFITTNLEQIYKQSLND
jgi:glycosyltransferase involved in cell wall biosynthesis